MTFDFSDINRVVRNLAEFEKQIPYALSVALNKSADVAREELPQTWAEHITVRNPNFLKAAMTTRGRRATKSNLRVELYDQYGRGNLNLHDSGGSAHGYSAMAIPTTSSGIKSKRGVHGVPKGMQPRNLPRAFAKTGKSGDTVIYQQTGKYRKGTKRRAGYDGRGVKLEYVTKPANRVPADVPISREWDRIMRREVPRQFSMAMKTAMATAFRKR